jgi:hypothetical protein
MASPASVRVLLLAPFIGLSAHRGAAMKTQSLVLLLVGLSMGCHHQGWFQPQDSSVRMPGYESLMQGAPIDGPTLRALRIAADDFFPAWGPPRACIDTPEAHTYYAVRRGEVIYVAIVQNPGHCDRAYSSLDSGVRYAISVEGRILRRLLDGEPEAGAASDDIEDDAAGAAVQDGGTAAIDVTIPSDARVQFPVSPDGGNPSPDGGMP